MKPDVVENDFAAKRFWNHRILGTLDHHRGIEQLEDSLGRGHGGLHDGVFLAEVTQRHKEAVDLLFERHQCPC
jgi:hypothetical protein